MTSRSERIFRALLRAYPETTRDASGDDMVQLFTDRLRDAGSRQEVATIWLEAIADIGKTAPRERLSAGRRARAQVVEGPIFYRPTRPDLLWTAAPLATAVVLAATRPGYWAPLFAESYSIGGVPLGMGLLILAGAMASVGIFLARRTDLGDPQVQFQTILLGLAPVPALVFVVGIGEIAAYAIGLTMFVLLAQFRTLMLALAIPFVVWLVAGPAVMLALLREGIPS